MPLFKLMDRSNNARRAAHEYADAGDPLARGQVSTFAASGPIDDKVAAYARASGVAVARSTSIASPTSSASSILAALGATELAGRRDALRPTAPKATRFDPLLEARVGSIGTATPRDEDETDDEESDDEADGDEADGDEGDEQDGDDEGDDDDEGDPKRKGALRSAVRQAVADMRAAPPGSRQRAKAGRRLSRLMHGARP